MARNEPTTVIGISKARSRLTRELEAKDRARERLILASRNIVRASSAAIAAMVRGERSELPLRAARMEWAKVRPLAGRNQDLAATGPLEGALQELAEAEILAAILRGRALPSHTALRLPASSYLMGLADCIGELRRLALNALAAGAVGLASARLRQMELLEELLGQLHFPSGLVPIKKRQDMARSLIERTRGEVVLGGLMARGSSPAPEGTASRKASREEPRPRGR